MHIWELLLQLNLGAVGVPDPTSELLLSRFQTPRITNCRYSHGPPTPSWLRAVPRAPAAREFLHPTPHPLLPHSEMHSYPILADPPCGGGVRGGSGGFRPPSGGIGWFRVGGEMTTLWSRSVYREFLRSAFSLQAVRQLDSRSETSA